MGWLRHPKTRQELCASYAAEADHREDYDIPPMRRGRRGKCYIPTAWDDAFKDRVRCWKKYRKTQYKLQDPTKTKKKPSKFRGHLNPRRIAWKKKGSWVRCFNCYRQCWYWGWRNEYVYHYEGVKGSKFCDEYKWTYLWYGR